LSWGSTPYGVWILKKDRSLPLPPSSFSQAATDEGALLSIMIYARI